MKFAIVGPAYPFRGGIAYFAGSLAKELEKQGHQVILINFRKQYPALLFPGKTQTEKDSFFSDLISERVLTPYNPFTYKKTLEKITAFSPDLIIFSFFLPYFIPAYHYLLHCLKKQNYQTMVLAHNIEFHEKWLFSKLLTKKLLKLTDYVVTLSGSVYEDAQRLIGRNLSNNRNRTKILKGFHPLYDFHNREQYSKEQAKRILGFPDKKIILFFGYIKPYKGIDLLIRSFPFIKEEYPGTVLIILGEVYGTKEKYYSLIEETGFREDILLEDKYIPSAEVELYFKGADVLVLPYRQATQSGVVQTAYVMDLGVVVTPVGGLPEMVVKEKTGVVADSVSEKGIASAIIHYFELDQELIRQNISELQKEYSWNSFVDFLLSDISESLTGSGSENN
jgi:glycosyltransferase involved in cell wall biosynthesis